ncbi:MAG: BrnT family toxin [Treponema sp.]|nr:BrnT family toxin [Treponema sp.]
MTTREIEFDPVKAKLNWQEHKVYFEDAALVFTDLHCGEKTRLISARAADKAEKRSYHGHDNNNSKGWSKAD